MVEHEREVYRQKAREEGKPEQIIEKIAEGAVKKFCKDVCLLDQLYIRDDKMTISDSSRAPPRPSASRSPWSASCGFSSAPNSLRH